MTKYDSDLSLKSGVLKIHILRAWSLLAPKIDLYVLDFIRCTG